MTDSRAMIAGVMDGLVRRLTSEGYDVISRPTPVVLPWAGYVPDLVAYKGDKKVAFDIGRSGTGPSAKKVDYQALRAAHPDWEFTVIRLPPEPPAIPPPKSADLDAASNRVRQLCKAGQIDAAFLLGWAALEATGRTVLPDRFERAQTGGGLVETLAHEGVVTPEQAGVLRSLNRKRNAIAHGDLTVSADTRDLDALLEIIADIRLVPAD